MMRTVIEIDPFTRRMGASEFMRFVGVKRDMAIRVIDMIAAAGIPSDVNLKLILRLPFDWIACLHDDLVRMSGDPYMTSAFAERVARSLSL
jgi:hypothetical protein